MTSCLRLSVAIRRNFLYLAEFWSFSCSSSARSTETFIYFLLSLLLQNSGEGYSKVLSFQTALCNRLGVQLLAKLEFVSKLRSVRCASGGATIDDESCIRRTDHVNAERATDRMGRNFIF